VVPSLCSSSEYSKEFRQVCRLMEDPRAVSVRVLQHALDLVLEGNIYKSVDVYSAQMEKEKGIFIEADADAVHDGGYVFAHDRPVEFPPACRGLLHFMRQHKADMNIIREMHAIFNDKTMHRWMQIGKNALNM